MDSAVIGIFGAVIVGFIIAVALFWLMTGKDSF